MRVEAVVLTMPELNHLADLLFENERTGEHTGNKSLYWKRHKRIMEKLEAAAMVQQRCRVQKVGTCKELQRK